MLQYALLHLFGYKLSMDDLKKVPGIDPKVIDAKKDHLTF